MTTRAKNRITKTNKRFGLTSTLASASDAEPRTVAQPLKDQRWRTSMSEEFNSQIRHRTWDLVPPHPSYNIIGTKWIFRTKFLPDGSVDKYKSRLVAKGYNRGQFVKLMLTMHSYRELLLKMSMSLNHKDLLIRNDLLMFVT